MVSASAGVTDVLEAAAGAAAGGSADAEERVDRVTRRYRALLEAVTSRREAETVSPRLDRLERGLRRAVRSARDEERCGPALRDEILSFGERMCAPVMAAALRSAGVDAEGRTARRLIRTDDEFGAARLDRRRTERAVRRQLAERSAVQVVPGFVGESRSEHTTTLGRGGSDFTAVALGASLDVNRVEIFTDVAGVMTADPAITGEAGRLARVSWKEMWVLSSLGAEVVQPRAVSLAMQASVPLRVAHFARPDEDGTLVAAAGEESPKAVIGVTATDLEDARSPGRRDRLLRRLLGRLAIDEDRIAELAVVGVVGAGDGEHTAGSIEGHLREASLSAEARGHGPARTVLFVVPAAEKDRAVATIHSALFDAATVEPARRR